jgi:hypothetical protein
MHQRAIARNKQHGAARRALLVWVHISYSSLQSAIWERGKCGWVCFTLMAMAVAGAIMHKHNGHFALVYASGYTLFCMFYIIYSYAHAYIAYCILHIAKRQKQAAWSRSWSRSRSLSSHVLSVFFFNCKLQLQLKLKLKIRGACYL